jgi:hypothetical protein
MSKVIIAIHGLGNKPPEETLSLWWQMSIIEGLQKINKFVYFPKFEMVYWADILNEKPLNELITDKENPYYLDEKYTPAPKNFTPKQHSMRKKVLSFIEDQMDKIFLNEDLSTNFSFVSDMVFRNYFKELEIYYAKENDKNDDISKRKQIRNRLVETLIKHKNDEIFLIAHSMGSIIAYDVLTFVLPDIKINTFVTMGSPLGLPVIVSKVAKEFEETFNRKEKLKTPPGVTNNWFNYSDLEDSVAINYNLANDFDKNNNGVKVKDIIVSNNYAMNEESNPHKSYGYLRTPNFSEALNEFLTKDKSKIELWFLKTYSRIFNKIKPYPLEVTDE